MNIGDLLQRFPKESQRFASFINFLTEQKDANCSEEFLAALYAPKELAVAVLGTINSEFETNPTGPMVPPATLGSAIQVAMLEKSIHIAKQVNYPAIAELKSALEVLGPHLWG